ncbi:MAG: LysM peptidoglycan-binding domain-containing protein [Ardenticatenaceae bacterium]|nr:LysM peptidoglycan-binding domain-containing protein [Ardenticatenaceae bacterium]HBY92356.1 hypothetical protein [Chloroflexota bacterium]
MCPPRPPLCLILTVVLALAPLIAPSISNASSHPPPDAAPRSSYDTVPLTPTPTAQITGHIHVVQPGETIKLIAAWYGSDVDTLAEVNGLSNPDLIHPGQYLVIPVNGDLSQAAQAGGEDGSSAAVVGTISISDTLEPTVDNIQAYIVFVFAPLGPEAQTWALRVAACESDYNPRAVNHRGNWHGLFQYHPITWAKFSAADIYDWQEQVRVTARLYGAGQTWRWSCR